MRTWLKHIGLALIVAALGTGSLVVRAQQATPLPPPTIAPVAIPAEAPQQRPTPQAPPPPGVQPGQQPPPRTPQPAPVAINPIPPPPPGQLVNVRIELTISDEGGSAAPVKKTVSMTVADRESGQIRSEAYISSNFPGPLANQSVPLHVDARPAIQPDGRIRVQMTLNYNVTFASGARPPTREDVVNSLKTEIREQLGFVLENGKPLVVSQSADPISDRRLTVEIKATVQR